MTIDRLIGGQRIFRCVAALGDLKPLDLGNYLKIEQAQRACERHYVAGCDLSKAEKR
jgi:hypothetical protein